MVWIWSLAFCNWSQKIELERWISTNWWPMPSSRVSTSTRSASNSLHSSLNWPLFRKLFVNISPKIWKLGQTVNCQWEKFFLLMLEANLQNASSQQDKVEATIMSSKQPRSTQPALRYPNHQPSKEPSINNCHKFQRTNVPCQIVDSKAQLLPKMKKDMTLLPSAMKSNTYSQQSISSGRPLISFLETAWSKRWFFRRLQRRNRTYYSQVNVK